jgi:hypothetical protein
MKAIALVMIILALAYPSFAASGEGGWGTNGGDARIAMLTRSGSSDSLDSNDLAAIKYNGWMAGSYHSADEWGSSAGFYIRDERAPLAPGETKTWMLYIWGVHGSATHDFGVSWPNSGSPDPLVQGKLELVQKPTGVTGGPALGTVWTTPPTSFTLPLYTTHDGLTGYGFKFTLTAVPEPSSLIALALGLLGIGAGVIRRRI